MLNLRPLHGRSELDEVEDPITIWMEGLIKGVEARRLRASFGTHTTARGLMSERNALAIICSNVANNLNMSQKCNVFRK